jgi:hypothetical protein
LLRKWFCANFQVVAGTGRAVAGKCPKRALKWYLGGLGASKIPYNTHFGARAIKMAHLGGSGASYSAFYGGPYGKGETPFYTKNCGNSQWNRVFARGPGAFYFWPVNLFLSLPEWKFCMLFCYFHDFPAWVVLFGQFSGRWRRGSGACWKLPENGFKTASGWPWRREKYPTVRGLAPWRPKWPT